MPRPRTARPRTRITLELDPSVVERLNRASDRTGYQRWVLVTRALQVYLDSLERMDVKRLE